MLFVAAAFAPAIFPRCPYKIPPLKPTMQGLRALLLRVMYTRPLHAMQAWNVNPSHIVQASRTLPSCVMQVLRVVPSLAMQLFERCLAMLHSEQNWSTSTKWTSSLSYNEGDAAKDNRNDVDILVDIATSQVDDRLLMKMCKALRETHADPVPIVDFVLKTIECRLQITIQR